MWQKSKYFCLTSFNRLLKTVEVDDLSNSDKVRSIIIVSESQMETSGILLIDISPASLLSLIISYNVFQRNLWLILYLHTEFGIWNSAHHKLDFLDWLLVWGYTVELTFLFEFLMGVHELQHTNFHQVKSEMLQDWGGGLDYGQDLA